PAGLAGLAAMAEEELLAAGRAQRAGENLRSGDACRFELPPIGGTQVQPHTRRGRFMSRRRLGKPGKWRGIFAAGEAVEGTFEPLARFRKLAGEGLGDFGSYFVAAGTDGWADGGEHVLGVRVELHLHASDGFLGDARQRAAPSRVHGSDGTTAAIDEQDGYAVGDLYGEEEAGSVGNERVAFQICGRQRVDPVNYVAVALIEPRKCSTLNAERVDESRAIEL